MEEKCKVALVDDHTLFRNGLKGLLNASGECLVVCEASNGEEFMQLLPQTDPDVVLLDIDMPTMNGFEVAQEMLSRDHNAKIITLSMHGDEDYYFKMVSLGVKGFLIKNSDIDEVVMAITTVNNGGSYFSQELLRTLVGSLKSVGGDQPDDSLSERELEILLLICQGLSNQEIADQLFISKRTVDKHRANILDKTGCKNTANLVVFAIKHRLVDIY